MTRGDGDRSRATRYRWLVWLLVGAAVIGPIYARALIQSRAELSKGHTALESDPYRAVTAYRHAVEWYAPGNPYSAEAVDALLAIGLAETSTQPEQTHALRALESLRTSILVTRSFYVPYADHLAAAEQRIAEIRGEEAAARTGAELEVEVARQLRLLRDSRARAPDAFWSLVTAVCFALWLGMTALFIRNAFRSQRRRSAFLAGGASLVCLAGWIVGLLLV